MLGGLEHLALHPICEPIEDVTGLLRTIYDRPLSRTRRAVAHVSVERQSPVTDDGLRAVARNAGIRRDIVATLVKRRNDVWLLNAGADHYYLKTYTKDWYADLASTGSCVRHERIAYETLAVRGLPSVEIIAASEDAANAIGRPFLLMRGLRGQSLTDALDRAADRHSFATCIATVAHYLAQMHAIKFEHAGYLGQAGGPSHDPDPFQWQHECWTADARRATALKELAHATELPRDLSEELRRGFTRFPTLFAGACALPRFVHGDCHAHQFFVTHGLAPSVTGVIDMEVSSAGSPIEDIMKFAIEMAGRYELDSGWWDAFLAGYGIEPDFEQLRWALLAFCGNGFDYLGPHRWRGSRVDICTRLLTATDWRRLLTAK